MAGIGGNLLSGQGGFLQLWNWAAGEGTPPVLPTPVNYRWFDVAWYRFQFHRFNSLLQYSGCSGAQRRRGVIVDWQLDARIWYDYDFPAHMGLIFGGAMAVRMNLGDASTWTGNPLSACRDQGTQDEKGVLPLYDNICIDGSQGLNLGTGILKPGPSGQASYNLPFYTAPMCSWGEMSIVDSSGQNDPDGIVYQDITLEGDSLLWYIDDGVGGRTYNVYQQYVLELEAKGYIPHEPAANPGFEFTWPWLAGGKGQSY